MQQLQCNNFSFSFIWLEHGLKINKKKRVKSETRAHVDEQSISSTAQQEEVSPQHCSAKLFLEK